ncbi:MAG: GTP-binding protein [Erysipelotrichaceae bacterium]|nr:GTP-binding protein [Erysipelotrichaceae bacterium]
MPVLVYLVTGFLDSGKTSLIKDTLMDKEFNHGEKNLIISFEQGEVEYEEAFLKQTNSEVVYVDDVELFTEELMHEYDTVYQPKTVIIEFNGLSNVTEFVQRKMIPGWMIVQVLTTIDASTFNVYIANMKSIIYEQIRYSDLIICNRCNEDTDLDYMRRNLKACNMACQIVYEDEQNNIIPFNPSKLVFKEEDGMIHVKDEDFGLWYMDALDHPEHYENKRIRIKGMYASKIDGYKKSFVLGRYAMVCCADDTALIGLTVTGVKLDELTLHQWVSVEGVIHLVEAEHGKVCVLYAEKIYHDHPIENPFVYFS